MLFSVYGIFNGSTNEMHNLKACYFLFSTPFLEIIAATLMMALYLKDPLKIAGIIINRSSNFTVKCGVSRQGQRTVKSPEVNRNEGKQIERHIQIGCGCYRSSTNVVSK